MNILFQIRRWAAQRTPGSVANIAAAKRRLESELRASGLSRNQAKTIVSMRYRD